jgi:prophage tail gpP-like protein
MSSEEFVVLKIDGKPYEGWKSMSVKYDAKSPERSFQVQASDGIVQSILSSPSPIQPGCEAELLSNGDLLVKGYIEDVERSFDANSHHLSISGKSKGKDAVDNSAVHGTGEFKDKNLLQIANELDKFGIGFKSDEDLRKITFRLNNGQTVFKNINRAARQQGLFLYGNADGSISITRHGKKQHTGGIIEGFNLKAGSSTFTEEGRHSDYIVKGQMPAGTKAENTQVKGEAKDEGVKRYRPKIWIAETAIDKQRAQERAEHMRAASAGESVKASITMQGFRDEGGRIWEAGWLVYTGSPTLLIDQDMAISSVELSQDEKSQGSLAKLELVHPSALRADKAKGKSKKSTKKTGGSSSDWHIPW